MSLGKLVRAASILTIAGTAGLLTAAVARAADEPPPPSPEKGYTLAAKFCQECHVIESAASATVPAGPPTFRAIANRPDQSAERLRNVLINPHPPMPDMSLSTAEILDLIAYIDTLRRDPALKPLLPAPSQPKPKHPSPS